MNKIEGAVEILLVTALTAACVPSPSTAEAPTNQTPLNPNTPDIQLYSADSTPIPPDSIQAMATMGVSLICPDLISKFSPPAKTDAAINACMRQGVSAVMSVPDSELDAAIALRIEESMKNAIRRAGGISINNIDPQTLVDALKVTQQILNSAK